MLPAARLCEASVGSGPLGVQLRVATWIFVWGCALTPRIVQGSTMFQIHFEALST